MKGRKHSVENMRKQGRLSWLSDYLREHLLQERLWGNHQKLQQLLSLPFQGSRGKHVQGSHESGTPSLDG